MANNSIRCNMDKDAIISDIHMTLCADFNKEKAIIVVEGTDDIKFLNGKLSDNVDIYESFSGKEGVKEIVSNFSEKRVLGICDKDYSVPDLNANIIYYDYSCLEMMLVSNSVVFKSFVDNFYYGKETSEDVLMKVLTNLKWLSIFRKLNSENSWGIKFKGLSIAAACVGPDCEISVEKLLENIIRINQDLINNHREYLIAVSNETRHELDMYTYLNITQGHDFIEYFQKIAQESSSFKRYVNKEALFSGLCCAFRESDFKSTKFFHSLKKYAEIHNFELVL